jgi:7,8-dihydropterin-6-yl-methyl-4-(beta-D-ribofuranosyl)aminobenzene 5'-phosphate synthase
VQILIKFTILAENRARGKGILGEHGLSILLEVDGFNVLLDAGQTDVFSFNASTKCIDLSKVDAMVVSHGHYDHTGGVPEFCRLNSKAPVYIHKDAFCERYNAVNNRPVGDSIGIPWKNDINSIRDRLIFTDRLLNINENITISGTVPLNSVGTPLNFVKRSTSGDFEKDMVSDEQFLIVKGKMGLYIFTGCSHPGVLNCVSFAKKIFLDENIYGLFGGMHLEKYTGDQLAKVIESLKSTGIEVIAPMHCTGIVASSYIKNALGDKCLLLNSGDEVILEK